MRTRSFALPLRFWCLAGLRELVLDGCNMMYKIEKNIPFPDGNKLENTSKTELRLVMERMEVGDSIVLNSWVKERTKVDRICGAIGFAYMTRQINYGDKNKVRMWRRK